MESGSRQLSKMATAYLASLGFGATFLLASLFGADITTALLRGAIAALACAVVGGALTRLVVRTVLDAMARDRAAVSGREDEA